MTDPAAPAIPEDLNPEWLHVFVFGPSEGESIVLRIPPNNWVVIDSCRVGGRAAALHLLTEASDQHAALCLTHPHRDHYRGLADVLQRWDWKLLGYNDERLEDTTTTRDPHKVLEGELEGIQAAIRRQWQKRPACRWPTYYTQDREVGEARLVVLHPDRALVGCTPAPCPNDLSSAILVEWRELRLLLGADVESHWPAISSRVTALNRHQFLKVPHHGSLRAVLNAPLAATNPPVERLWVVTPFATKGLPRAADGEGLHHLLTKEQVIHLTGLPVPHNQQDKHPCVTTRPELRDGHKPRPVLFGLPGGWVGHLAEPPAGDPANFVYAAFDSTGKRHRLIYGPGSVRVTET